MTEAVSAKGEDGMTDIDVPWEAFDALPVVDWDHVDGPVITWAGQIHWLTWEERFSLALKLTTPEGIAAKRFGRRVR